VTSHLNFSIVDDIEERRAWIMQPHLADKDVEVLQAYATSETPRLMILRPTDGIN
jgi:hypothetical protein